MKRSGDKMKFQIYTEDGRWVETYQIDDKEFADDEDYYGWEWNGFFKFVSGIVREENERAYPEVTGR